MSRQNQQLALAKSVKLKYWPVFHFGFHRSLRGLHCFGEAIH